jgi:hypothetical protein
MYNRGKKIFLKTLMLREYISVRKLVFKVHLNPVPTPLNLHRLPALEGCAQGTHGVLSRDYPRFLLAGAL